MDKLKWYEWLICFVIVFGIRQVFFTGKISFDNLICNENCQREKRENSDEWAKWREDMNRARKAVGGMKTFTDYNGKPDYEAMDKHLKEIKRDPFRNF